MMARSRDWDELQHVWIEWHRKTGQKIKELYVQLVDLSNYAAQLNSEFGYTVPKPQFDRKYEKWTMEKPIHHKASLAQLQNPKLTLIFF
jgi:hypothetical protein